MGLPAPLSTGPGGLNRSCLPPELNRRSGCHDVGGHPACHRGAGDHVCAELPGFPGLAALWAAAYWLSACCSAVVLASSVCWQCMSANLYSLRLFSRLPV